MCNIYIPMCVCFLLNLCALLGDGSGVHLGIDWLRPSFVPNRMGRDIEQVLSLGAGACNAGRQGPVMGSIGNDSRRQVILWSRRATMSLWEGAIAADGEGLLNPERPSRGWFRYYASVSTLGAPPRTFPGPAHRKP